MKNFTSCAGMILDSGTKILIDTSMGMEDTRALLIEEDPDYAIISHYHLDHGVWAPQVLETTEAELFVPSGEEDYFSSAGHFVDNTAGPYGLGEQWRDFMTGVTGYREISGFSTYNASTITGIAGTGIRCIPTPGHSPAHCSFFFPEEGILFTGDLGLDPFGPWYGWDDCDLEMLADSLMRLKALSPRLLLTSHGGIIRDSIHERFDRLLHTLLERERKIARSLEKGSSREEIIEDGVFYFNKHNTREPMRSFLYMWDEAMYVHHRSLLDKGGLSVVFPDLAGIK